MRFLEPLLVGATLIVLAAPALASAEPYYGDRGSQYDHRDGGYNRYDYRGSYRHYSYHRGYGEGEWRRDSSFGGYGDRHRTYSWTHHRREHDGGW